MTDYALGDAAESAAALDLLLYHAEQARAVLRSAPPVPLDPQRRAVLEDELRRDEALVSIRVVGDDDSVLLGTDDVQVALGEKAHLLAQGAGGAASAGDFSGTVLRVGQHHMWARY